MSSVEASLLEGLLLSTAVHNKAPLLEMKHSLEEVEFASLAEMASFIQPLRNVMISEMPLTDVTVLA